MKRALSGLQLTRRKFIRLAGLTTGASLIPASQLVSPPAVMGGAQKINVKFAHFFPSGTPWQATSLRLAELMAQKSGGSLTSRGSRPASSAMTRPSSSRPDWAGSRWPLARPAF